MGYKMPIVYKEVYLPFDTNVKRITFAEYKEKYGVDIAQYINEEGEISAENTKFFVVIDGAVFPLQSYFNNQNQVVYGRGEYGIDANAHLLLQYFNGFIVNNVDEILTYYEI